MRWLSAIVAIALAGCGGSTTNQPDAGVEAPACVPDGGNLCPDPAVISPNEAGWWRNDVFYEVFVRSFYDSDGNGKGDLAGVTAKLDYMNDGDPATTTDLGVKAIWLMPIFESPSYHGYDVTDYRKVDPDYGTLEDFDALIAAAHQRGIKVILDMVLNHSSSQHPWFVSSKTGAASPYRDFYVWRDAPPSPPWTRWDGSTAIWHYANGSYYYGVFWSGMPDLNWRNPAVEAEFVDIMKFWLARGADGFRIDAARYLVESADGKIADQPETHDVFQRLRNTIHQSYPDALFVAEAWTSNHQVATYYGEGNEFQLAFNFDLADGIIDTVNAGTPDAVNMGDFTSQQFHDRGFSAPFLTNHDLVRVMRQLSASGTEPAWTSARLAAALLMAQPGTPFLYYGEELGMMGGSQPSDEEKRTPMHWTGTAPGFGFTTATSPWYSSTSSIEPAGIDVETQRSTPTSLWSLYRELIALRGGSIALSSGVPTRPAVTGGNGGLFAMLRTGQDGKRVLFVANVSKTPSGAFTVAVDGVPTVLYAEGLSAPPTSGSGALSFAELSPQSFAFVQVD